MLPSSVILFFLFILFIFPFLFSSPHLVGNKSEHPTRQLWFGNGIVFTLRQCFNFCSTRSVIGLPTLVAMHSLLHHEESDMLTKFRLA